MKRYRINKHKQLSELNNKNIYILWLESDYGCYPKHQGTKKECREKLKEILCKN